MLLKVWSDLDEDGAYALQEIGTGNDPFEVDARSYLFAAVDDGCSGRRPDVLDDHVIVVIKRQREMAKTDVEHAWQDYIGFGARAKLEATFAFGHIAERNPEAGRVMAVVLILLEYLRVCSLRVVVGLRQVRQ